ncbi:MAG: flagellar hook-length control protein FliK [Candidatus Kapabacteria bacterium]|nr:flagellar hook-length control protein FliK [Candidatus Kapabacteria bacterium]
MADLTKIVPSSITSSLTVSEVNGISLTKSKQNTESTLPTTSFAEILEAQLSQNNIQTDETPTDAKQILPGQSVDTSLFGSLIVVVRDVEVPVTDQQETPLTNENSRLFIPTVFTASTTSAVSVAQLPKPKPSIEVESNIDTNNLPVNLQIQAKDVTQNTSIEQQITERIQPVPSNPARITSNQEQVVSESLEESEDIPRLVVGMSSPNTVALTTNIVISQQPIPTQQQVTNNASVDSNSNGKTQSIDSSNLQQTPTVSSIQTQLNTKNTVSENEGRLNAEDTFPVQSEKVVATQSVINTAETPIVAKTESASTTKQVSEASPRTLSSMLQSVQGLKMGIERTPTQQTFITVALPISEVQRLVVANPEVFTSKKQISDNIPNEVSVDPKSFNTQKSTISSQINESNNVDVTNSEIESVVIQTVSPNRENLFVPSSFVVTNSNDYSQNAESENSNTSSVSSINRQEVTSKTKQTEKDITSNFEQNNKEVSRIQPLPNSENSAPNRIPSTESEIPQNINASNTVSNTNEREIFTSPKQQTHQSIATTIENFATNLQTISSPKVSTPTQLNTDKEPKEFPFQAKIEKISEKNTLVLEPLQKQSIQKPNQAVAEPIEPKYTVTKLLQKADEEGITIESIVVKIPVQSTKNIEVQKETDLTTEQQSLPSPFTKDTTKLSNVVVTNETAKVSIPEAQSTLTRSIQSSKGIPTQTIQTPKQQGNLGTTRVTSKESTPIDNQAVRQIVSQNEQSTQMHSSKEVAVQKTETSSNTKQENSNFSPRRDVASILQRVENIQQRSTNVEVNNQTSITNTTENILNNQAFSPKVTPNLTAMDSVQTVEVTSKQPIEVKNSPIVEESTQQEISNELANITTVGVSPISKTISPTVPVVDSKIIETPVSVEELPEAIVQEFVTDTTEKGTKATFTLNPEQLGKVQVEVTVKDNNASITLESSRKETIPMLEKQIDTLKEQLKTSNVIVEKLEVIFKPNEIIQPSTTMNDTFTNSQQMEQQSLQQEIDRRAQQQQRQNNQSNTVENDTTSVEEIQPKRFGDGSSIIEEYI